MSSSRYPDGNRYPRERSPYRDRRPSTYASGYPPRASDSTNRSNVDSGPFPPRDVPRGPKSLVDAPRGPTSGPPAGIPSGPRDGRGRGFAGRGDGPPSLRDAPPLTNALHNSRDHNSRDHWRADRDRDRDRDFRDRRPSPPRRSPIRDSRDFPRDLDINRARRNSRDGPPSAGSTYSDPPLGIASTYRGSGIGRGRGTGREFSGDFRGRGRTYLNDDRDRHHDARDRMPDRAYRPRSRSRDPVRRDRDLRDDRDFDRRDRDERRFDRRDDEPRRYDSYLGSASTLKSGMRTLDTHRGSTAIDSRNIPGTPTGPPTPHSTHHPATGDRLGPTVDSYSRRSSIATEPLSAKDARRESDRNDLLASRAEASRERYAPRASSPPAAVPAFGFSNVWRNPALDAKPNAVAHTPKPVAPTPPAPAPAPAAAAPAVPAVPKSGIPSGLSTVPPTGPKADRISDRPQGDSQVQDNRAPALEQPRIEPSARLPPVPSAPAANAPGPENVDAKLPAPTPTQANSPPFGQGVRNRVPPTGPQAALRSNTSPSFPRPQQLPYAARDASPGAIPLGPRNTLSLSTSPKSTPLNIPTGPKADRANPMATRAPMYAPPDRSPFSGPRMPLGGAPKSMQWVRPGLNRPPTIPSKREFPSDDRERSFGTIPKAPKLEGSMAATEPQRSEQSKPEMPSVARSTTETDGPNRRMASGQVPQPSPTKPIPVETRRLSDVSMPDASPSIDQPPVSATSSTPKVLEDSDDDLDLDEDDFAESEAKYHREKALLESKRVDLSASHLRATSPLQDIMLLSSLSLEHLPRQESKPADEENISPTPIQPPPESATTELPTPKAEEPEDVVMEEKDEKSLAPATRALRLRREPSPEQEMTPDLSSLPYLGSAPPTPLSDLDQDRPSFPDSLMLAIRNNLQRDIVPEMDPEDVLRQYAAAYKNWRLFIRELDEEREHEEQERQPSTEPGLKATTPDVQSSAMAAMLGVPPPTTGRRSHRFASELELEQVIKESLKTAEEERMGKKEKEPRKSMSDPEREATVPLELTEYETQRRRFVDTNFQREPGQGIFVYHYEPPEDDFTELEHKVMVQHYRDQYAKKWGKLAEILHKEAGTSRTYKDTINHYYATKWGKEYKGKVKGRRGGARKRGGGTGRGRGGANNVERSDVPGDDGLTPLPLTDSGRPRRLAAPTFGAEMDADPPAPVPTPGRQRRQTDVDGTQEKVGRRGKIGKERGGRKLKNQPLAAAPIGSPMKTDRKERALGVKMEEEFGKRPLGEMALPMQPSSVDDQPVLQTDAPIHMGIVTGITERPRSHTNARPGPSSYWSVTEQNDFHRNIAHFGTDWAAIANHMGTKTQTMVKNQYLRLVEGGSNSDLANSAKEADKKRERGEDPGPPPTPTPAPKRRYESSQTIAPRALAPTPEGNDMKSPTVQPVPLPKFSPPLSTASTRFSTIAQAPPQAKAIVPANATASMSESPLAAIPSLPQQQSPPTQTPRVQSQHHHHHSHSHSQQKPHHPGPRAGYFSDDLPPRLENRPPSQSSSIVQPRPLQQQIQPQIRAPEQPQAPAFRAPAQQEREAQPRLETQVEHDSQARFQPQHSRRVSQEHLYPRQFQSTASNTAQIMSQIRSASGAGSPETRPLQLQQPRHIPQAQPHVQPPSDVANQAPKAMSGCPPMVPRSAIRTPPVKEEPRQYPLPPQLPQSQPPPQLSSQPQTYSHHSQSVVQSPAAPPAPKPATEPRKSNLLSLLNDTEPEEPRRKKPSEVPSHTSTPQQQTPIAPPPPVTQSLPLRRDPYMETNTTQPPYGRPPYAAQPPQSQPSSSRQIVDLTSEHPGARSRESWQQRQTFHHGQSQAQQAASLSSPHMSLAQPNFNDSRILGNHRSVFAQHNMPRHNPSPPPLSGYSHSPNLHSRTPSVSGPSSQQPRHGINSTTPVQHAQPAPGTSQILQPNPYAQVDPPGSSSQSSAPVGMRPSPHLHTSSHVAQQRDIQSRNEQQQAHNANLAYSNPQTPNELHPAHQHLRGPSVTEHYRPRDPRDFHDFDARNHDRDVSRELSQRGDHILREREQRESLMSRTVAPQQSHQDLRYQHPPQQDRGYATQRSHTPLSRSEHVQHPSLQHPSHPFAENSLPSFGHRQQEESQHQFRGPYPPRDERERLADRIREEQAHQQARIRGSEDYLGRERELRDRELRERDARYREDLMRRESHGRLPGPPPGAEQRQGPGGPMDWASAVPRHQERWQR